MLKYKIIKKPIVAAAIGALLTFMMVPQNTKAIEPLEVGAEVSLDVNFISGAEFNLYKVGEISKFGEAKASGAFAKYPVSYENLDTSDWKTLAETLEVYVEKDSIEPVDSGTTDANGTLHFPSNGQKMTTGLYLLIGEDYNDNHEIYTIEPALVCLPNRDANGQWMYDVELSPKYETATEMTEIQVIKQWDDKEDSAGKRPESIEVQLLKNGEVAETITLNKENDWRYTWTDLEASHEWRVAEKAVENGYTVEVERDGNTFIVTNTYKTSGTTSEITPGGRLPQTGMYWWPVPVLAAAGMIFFMIGWMKRRKSES